MISKEGEGVFIVFKVHSILNGIRYNILCKSKEAKRPIFKMNGERPVPLILPMLILKKSNVKGNGSILPSSLSGGV